MPVSPTFRLRETWVALFDSIAAQREAVAAAEQITGEFLKLDALATCRNNLAEAMVSAKNTAEAEPIFRQALGDYRTLAGRFPNEIDYQWSVAMVLTNIADVADQRGRAQEALDLVDKAAKNFINPTASLGEDENFQGHRSKNERLRELIRGHLDPTSTHAGGTAIDHSATVTADTASFTIAAKG